MKIPQSIVDNYNKLYDLCEQYPQKIPVEKVAEFLGMDIEGLRSSIDQGRCQFALCVQKNTYGNRAFTVNTLSFFSWATNGAIFHTLMIKKLEPVKPRKYKRKTKVS